MAGLAGLANAYKSAVGGMMGAPMASSPQPKFPGGPPPPTGIGAMDTGDALTPRAQVQAAIMAIRKLGDSYPSMADRIEGMIAEIKSATSDAGKPTSEAMEGDEMPPPPLPPMPPAPAAGANAAGGGALPPLPM